MLLRNNNHINAMQGRRLAAPSWVFPGSIAENCAFLAGKVHEVGLLFMESASALAYGPDDLQPGLADLPLAWHVHLPADLDWQKPEAAAGICLALMDKAAYLGAARAVLHPPRPENATDFISRLNEFMLYWRKAGRDSADLMLENLPGHDARLLLEAAQASGASLCLDLAHAIISGWNLTALAAEFMPRVRLLHLCAPGPGGKGHHHPLTALGAPTSAQAREICRKAEKNVVFMLELFNWPDYLTSLDVLNTWME